MYIRKIQATYIILIHCVSAHTLINYFYYITIIACTVLYINKTKKTYLDFPKKKYFRKV